MLNHNSTSASDPTRGTARQRYADALPTCTTPKGGVEQALIEVKAPPGAANANRQPLYGYKMRSVTGVHHGRPARTGAEQLPPYHPKLEQTFLDTAGPHGDQVQLLRDQVGTDPATITFRIVQPSPSPYTSAASWTYLDKTGAPATVTLTTHQPVLPQVNLLPTVTGSLIADHEARFDANLSSPGQSLTGSFDWDIYRVDDEGAVIDGRRAERRQRHRRLVDPGKYRAEVHFEEAGPTGIDRYGFVEFTVRSRPRRRS